MSAIDIDDPTVPAGTTQGKQFVNRFGLPTATALVIGSIIGTGVFALPSALAPYGPGASLLAFGLVTSVRWPVPGHRPGDARRGSADHEIHALPARSPRSEHHPRPATARHLRSRRRRGHERGLRIRALDRVRPGRQSAPHDQGDSRRGAGKHRADESMISQTVAVHPRDALRAIMRTTC